jgi:multidrug efflux pump subunit AcrB
MVPFRSSSARQEHALSDPPRSWVIIGGFGFANLFTLFLIPVMYRILAPLSEPRAADTQCLVE